MSRATVLDGVPFLGEMTPWQTCAEFAQVKIACFSEGNAEGLRL